MGNAYLKALSQIARQATTVAIAIVIHVISPPKTISAAQNQHLRQMIAKGRMKRIVLTLLRLHACIQEDPA